MKITKNDLKKLIRESLEEVMGGSVLNPETVFSQDVAKKIQIAYQTFADGAEPHPDEARAMQPLVDYLSAASRFLQLFADGVEGVEQEAEHFKSKLNIK